MTLHVGLPDYSNILLRMSNSSNTYRVGCCIVATSIGANVRKGKHARSDSDFMPKISIAYKEADESDFWLNLLHENRYTHDKQFTLLIKSRDGKEFENPYIN